VVLDLHLKCCISYLGFDIIDDIDWIGDMIGYMVFQLVVDKDFDWVDNRVVVDEMIDDMVIDKQVENKGFDGS
jgi:hypothetical protein